MQTLQERFDKTPTLAGRFSEALRYIDELERRGAELEKAIEKLSRKYNRMINQDPLVSVRAWDVAKDLSQIIHRTSEEKL